MRTSVTEPAADDDRSEGDLDLRTLGAAVWRKKRWVVLPTLIALIGSIGYVQTVAPLYRSTGLVLLERGESSITRPTAGDQTVIDAETVASQVQLIESRDLARRVVNDLKLVDDPTFSAPPKGMLGRLLGLVGLDTGAVQRSAEEQAIETFGSRLTVYPLEKTRVIAVEFSSTDPDLAGRVVNEVADAYIALQRDAKQAQTRNATQWLAAEVEQLRARVEEAEAKVSAARTGANLLVGSNNTTLAAQQLGELNTQLSQARSAQSQAQVRAQILRGMLTSGQSFDTSEIANSELIRRLSEQRAALRSAIASEGRTLLPGHPRMKELSAQIAGLESQIRTEGDRLTRSFESDAKLAGARVETLTRELEEQKKLTVAANDEGVQLRALEREAKAQRDLLEQLLGRYREASARESPAAIIADARVISRGAVPTMPYFPKKLSIVLMASIGTLVLSLTLVGAGELFLGSSSGAAAADQRRAEAPPALGEVPVYGRLRRGSAERPALDTSFGDARGKVDAADTAVVDALAEQLAGSAVDGRGMRILVTAATRETAAGPVALALGRAITEASRRVVLIEVGETVPGLGGEAGPGLAQLIDASASFADVIHRDPRSRVHFIPRGAGTLTLDRQAVERLAIAVDALGLTYDFVVLIGPKAEGRLDGLAALSDSAILVAAGGAGDAATVSAHEKLVATGLEDVVVLLSPGGRPPDDEQRLAA